MIGEHQENIISHNFLQYEDSEDESLSMESKMEEKI